MILDLVLTSPPPGPRPPRPPSFYKACSAQDPSACSTDGLACAVKAGQTTTLSCEVPATGHWNDDGIATACTTQTGCELDTSPAVCTTGADVTQLQCETLLAGYDSDDDFMLSGE